MKEEGGDKGMWGEDTCSKLLRFYYCCEPPSFSPLTLTHVHTYRVYLVTSIRAERLTQGASASWQREKPSYLHHHDAHAQYVPQC